MLLQMDQRMRTAMIEVDPWSTFADNLKHPGMYQ